MSESRTRRNRGRILGVVIESADLRNRKGLQALSEVTRETFRHRGLDVSQWPSDVRELMSGVGAASRIIRQDKAGDQHVFAIADCGNFDLLVGVSSRRVMNVPGDLTGNLATNVLLEVLDLREPEDPTCPRYGQVGAEDLNRLWRNEVGAAHVQSHASNWDLVLWSRSEMLDYLVPGTSLMGLIRGNQASEQATSLVVNSSKHKSTGHSEGKLKYASGQTHPVVRVHPGTKKIVGWNEDVVAALRDAVRLLRAGASWDEAVAVVGDRIPAPQAQQEPDDDHDGTRTRTRVARNAHRTARGLPELPLRFLPDGSVNPDYRPESICDLNRPAERLKELLVWGVTVPSRDKTNVRSRVDTDLDGIAPEDVFHSLYTTGVYRRLVKNQELSNSEGARYQWAALNLGPTANGESILTKSDVEFLRSYRTGKKGTGSWGNNPLTGVFRLEQSEPLYTSSGWINPADGKFVVRSGSNGADRGLRLWFEPRGATPHSNGCQSLGWTPNSAIGPEIARMLVDAISREHDLAEFRFEHPAIRTDPLVAAKQAIADLERRYETLIVRIADPDLSDMAIAGLKRTLVATEQELADAHEALAAADSTALTQPSRHDDTFDISEMAQLAAVLASGIPTPPKTAERVARLLKTTLLDPRMTLDRRKGIIRIEATLMLNSREGQLTIPLRGHVTNKTTDPWVAGLAGMWWERRTVPFSNLVTERGLSSNPGSTTRWHQVTAKRLLEVSAGNGHPLRGPNLAALLVRCPDPDLLGRIRTAIETGTTNDSMHRFLFDGPDIIIGRRWTESLVTQLAKISEEQI